MSAIRDAALEVFPSETRQSSPGLVERKNEHMRALRSRQQVRQQCIDHPSSFRLLSRNVGTAGGVERDRVRMCQILVNWRACARLDRATRQ
eukprot:15455771-Alexandrium_andersonii.AAC.1